MMKKLRSGSLLAVVSIFLGCGFLSYETHAQNNLQPVERVTVYDANAKRVGVVLGFHPGAGLGIPIIAFRVDGRLATLLVEPHRFFGFGATGSAGNLLFESANCAGTPFLSGAPSPSLAVNNVLDGTKLYANEYPTQRTIIVRSQGSTSQSNVPCEPVNPFQVVASPLRFLIDLGTQFQPPFTLR
ncbi:MAG: hypothetical protein A3J28_17635 [Acidobacteria bacterium RIFCSPLOWO2_12_FULL_60_22]|nr:MAG: hypothetical protein A3J28_17635 [Acidobacteria bacterium RIFCSPLOWO2_12_FULL_60_22]